MGTEKLATLVNTFGSSLMTVSKEMGVELNLAKAEIAQGVNVQGSCLAALVGVVGGGIQGTAVIMLDEGGFRATVSAMSGGMITPNLEDPVSMSVIGELANMVSGRALIQAALEGTEVTPPQLISGAGIKTIPNQSPGVRSFTLPFKLSAGGTLFLVLSFSI
jgi:chemotaxis protein CheX